MKKICKFFGKNEGRVKISVNRNTEKVDIIKKGGSMIITIEPIVILTIYGSQSEEEDYATEHPDSTAAFMLDWRRKEIERWTFLQPEYAHNFLRAQADWKSQGGEIYVSDGLRTIKTQIDLIKRKPTLAARPGTSLHGLGMALDYHTEKLGYIEGKKMTFKEFDEHLKAYGWRVHPRAFRSSSHAEAWHIQPTQWRGRDLNNRMEVFETLMREMGPKIKDREKQIVNKIAQIKGDTNLSFEEQVKEIQKMGKLIDDGIIGPNTRGYLAILDLEYQRVASTFEFLNI